MNSLKEFKLGQEAIDYIKHILEVGKTLSRCILENCNLNYGKVKTYLPSSVSDRDVNEFKYGGKL
jgi:hypothetical protein